MNNMKNKITIILAAVMLLTGSMIAFANKAEISASTTTPVKEIALDTKVKSANNGEKNIVEGNYICTSSLDIVANPSKYLNKNVKFKATFDKFSTLGLDYKPAFRDSEKYLSFLIKRDDVTDHTIPLSEMKIFIKRDYAEKFIELDSGDIIEVYGKVFSDALTDTWMDTDKIVIVEKKNKDTKDKK